VGKAESTAALQGVARQGCVERRARDCTDTVVSSGCVWAHPWAQTVYGGLALTDTGQQQRLLTLCSGSTGREALIRNGFRPRSLRIRRLGVRIPPGALCVETDDQALTSGNAGWGLCRVE